MFRTTVLLMLLYITTAIDAYSLMNPEAVEVDSSRKYQTPSITVTTNRAVEGKNPVPFSTMTKESIDNTYINKDLTDLISEMPSVLVISQNGNSIGYSNLSMRGFDQRRISVMINGIPQNDPEDHNVYWIDFPDLASSLDNIQVQRGAGLSNYGAAAIGGSINLTTSNFTNEKMVKIFSGIGYQQYGAGSGEVLQPTMSKFSMEVSSGLVDNYAFYGRLSRINSDGYRDNSYANMNSYFLSAVRFDDNFTTQINIFGGPFMDGLAYNGLPKAYIKDKELRRKNYNYWSYDEDGKTVNWTTTTKDQELEEFTQPHYEILNDWYINENLTFKSSLFYYTGEGYFDFDGAWADGILTDWVSGDYTFNDEGTFKNSIIRGYVSNKHGGWIPRMVWNHGGGELTMGAEMRVHRSDHWGKISFSELLPDNYDPDYKFYGHNGERETFSFFAREQYSLTDRLLLSAEAQLVMQNYRISGDKQGGSYINYVNMDGETVSGEDAIFDISYLFVNPRLGATYKLNDDMNCFALLAYTSREPRMKNLYNASESYLGEAPMFKSEMVDGQLRYDFSEPLVNPEKMIDIELGYNYRTARNFIGVNFYWMDYIDELVKSGQTDIFGEPITGNAPKTRHMGIELQGSTYILGYRQNGLQLSANMTMSSNKIIEYDYIRDDKSVLSLEDNDIAGFPSMMANFRLSYVNNDFFVSLLTKYVGKFATDNFGDMRDDDPTLISELGYADNKVDDYVVMNADISYTIKDFLSLQSLKIHVQVNNLLNRLYASGGEGMLFFPAAERNIFLGFELGL